MINEKFDAGRAADPTVRGGLDIPYTQTQWNALTDQEKGLWILNKERADRGIAPYTAVVQEARSSGGGTCKYYMPFLCV